MKILKNWIVDLILSIIFLTFAVLLFIPDISIKIVSYFVGALLIAFFVLQVVPKYKRMKNVNAEWVTWVILESILIVALAVLSILNNTMSIDLGFVTLELSHIIGLLFIIEGVIGLIKLCNLMYVPELKHRPKRYLKYIYILLVIIGTYILCSFNITSKQIAYGVAVFCIIVFIICLTCMIQILVKKKKPSKK